MQTRSASQTLRYSIIQMLYWGSYLSIVGYASVFLLDHGLSNTLFGIVLAAAALVTVVLQPVVARIIDSNHHITVRRAMLFFIASFLVATALTLVFEHVGSGFFIVPFLICMVSLYLINPLVNSLGMDDAYPVDFGLARGLGSTSYALSSLVVGHLVSAMGSQVILPVMFVLFSVLLFAVKLYPDSEKRGDTPVASSSAERRGFFSRYPIFALVVIGLAGLLIGHAMTANFGYQVVADKGGDTNTYGWAIAISVLCELPPMFFYSKLEKRFSRSTMLVVSAIAFSLKIVLSYMVSTSTGYLAVQPLQLLAWGLISVNFVAYVKETIAAEDAVMGQSWFTNAQMIGSIASSSAGGAIIDAFGVPAAILLGAVASIVGTVCILVAVSRPRHQPLTANGDVISPR